MDRRYQVFISSTFEDLIDERKAIMEGLLKINCLPAGMELFPAADDDQWTLIKGVIDQCDYYLIVSARRYGSVDAEGISYTEREYDYAVEKGIPVIGFLPKNPGSIISDKVETDNGAPAKLETFQKKIKSRMVSFYESAAELQANVIIGVMNLQNNRPSHGWVRGDQAMTDQTRADIAELRATIAGYEKKEAESKAASALEVNKSFAHGTESFEVNVTLSGMDPHTYHHESQDGSFVYSWDEILELVGPYMIEEASEPSLRKRMETDVMRLIVEEGGWANYRSPRTSIADVSWGTIIVQLRALGVIQTGTKKRTVSDKAVYWKLTPAGDDYLVALRAIPHDPDHEATAE